MKLSEGSRSILLYGLLGGVIIATLKVVEYRFLVLEHSLEIYGGIIAAIFAGLGIWLGLKLTKTKEVVREVHVPVDAPARVPSAQAIAESGLTPRELEILQAIADGLSTREIAEKLFVSENTVKTHSSRLFEKLSVRRRTQAVQRASELGLLG
jgi:DNA-binding CsgD family transcriptional regulator